MEEKLHETQPQNEEDQGDLEEAVENLLIHN